MISFLENALNQSPKFMTKNRFEMNDDSRVTYSTNNQIKF